MAALNSKKSGRTKTTNEQHQRFVETARQLECDEDQERFEKKLGKIASPKIFAVSSASKGNNRGRNNRK
jgi:hypothetical protein